MKAAQWGELEQGFDLDQSTVIILITIIILMILITIIILQIIIIIIHIISTGGALRRPMTYDKHPIRPSDVYLRMN